MTQNVGIVLPVTGSRKPGPYVRGLTVTWVSATTLSLGAGGCTDSTDAISMVVPASIVLNSAIVGAGGMDKGALANNTFYYIYVIASSAALTIPIVSAVISLSATAPSLPTGYDAFRLAGTVLTDGSAEFLPFSIEGKCSSRVFAHKDPIEIELPETGDFPISYTALSLAPAVAAIAHPSHVCFLASIKPVSAGHAIFLSIDGTHACSALSCSVAGVLKFGDIASVSTFVDSIPQIYYRLSSASTTSAFLRVKSFTFNV